LNIFLAYLAFILAVLLTEGYQLKTLSLHKLFKYNTFNSKSQGEELKFIGALYPGVDVVPVRRFPSQGIADLNPGRKVLDIKP